MDNSKKIKEWIKRAHSCLGIAMMEPTDIICNEDLCFNAQQSAEKALKALLLHQGLEIPKTHSFDIILNKLKERMILPKELNNVLDLNDYAVFTRYPGDYVPLDDEERKDAVNIAQYVFNWVKENIK